MPIKCQAQTFKIIIQVLNKVNDLFKNIYLWLHWIFIAVCSLSLVVVSRACFFVAMYELLIAVASLDVEHRLQARGLSSCGTLAYLLCVMWKLPEPGIEPVSPALAGRLLPLYLQGSPANFYFQISEYQRERGSTSFQRGRGRLHIKDQELVISD